MNWSAVITTYNSGSVIEPALKSIFSLPPPERPRDVVVVDNASTDSTAKVLSRWTDRVRVVLNSRNMGLSRANAAGAEAAEGDSLFFLNPDVELIPGAAEKLFQFQEAHPEAAILGPAMIDPSGKVQSTARTWPSLAAVASRRTAFGATSIGERVAGKHMETYSSSHSVRPQWLVGAAMWLTPAGRKRTGLMSTDYFLYFEDVEWCWRAWRRGMEVWYVPEARIRHVCQRESAAGGSTLRHHLRSMCRFYLTHPGALFGLGPGGER